MITEERLQEIKSWWGRGWGNPDAKDVVVELIAAYENQGELLQLSLANVDRLNDDLRQAQAELAEATNHLDAWGKRILDLRKQLAEAKAELDEASKDQVQSAKAYEDTWKELQTYIKLWKETIKQRDEAQAECERLRNMRGFTPDASRDK